MAQIKNVLFGKLAVSTKFITEEQLDECLKLQKEIDAKGEKPPRLGEILEQKGYLTRQQLTSLIETMQNIQKRRFGEIAVSFKFITQEQLDKALEVQNLLRTPPDQGLPLIGQTLVVYRNLLKQSMESGALPKIGEILAAMGYLKPHQINVVLEDQGKCLAQCTACGASLNIGGFSPGQRIRCGQCSAVLDIVAKPTGEIDVAIVTEQETVQTEEMDPDEAMKQLEKEIEQKKTRTRVLAARKSVFGDYMVVTRLGQDSTGASYRAHQMSKRRPVALKIMNESAMSDAAFAKRFIEEGKAVATIEHPNIRKIYSIGKVKERYYISMEYFEGESIYGILQKQGKIHYETALNIVEKAAEALEYAAAQNIIHKDIRPSNLMMLNDGTVKLMNLGVATKTVENIMQVARSGQLAPFYIAPEQVTGDRPVDMRSDIYSLGATLYHMVAGRPPFEGQSPFEVLVRLTEETIPPLNVFDPTVPQGICRLVEKMLQIEPDDRFQSWGDVLSEIRRIRQFPDAVPGYGVPSASAKIPEEEERRGAYVAQTALPGGTFLKLGIAAAVIVAIVGIIIYINKYATGMKDEEEFKKACQSWTENKPKRHYNETIGSFQQFIKEHPESKLIADAKAKIAEVESTREEDAQRRFEEIQKAAQSKASREQFGLAYAEFEYLEVELRLKPIMDKVAQERSAIVKSAKDKLQSVVAGARKQADEKKFDDALKMISKAKEDLAYGCFEDDQRWFDDQLAECTKYVEQLREKDKADQTAAANEQRKKDSAKLLEDARQALNEFSATYSYQPAIDKCDELLRNERLIEEHKKPLAELKKELQARLEVKKKVVDRLSRMLLLWRSGQPSPTDTRPRLEVETGIFATMYAISDDELRFEMPDTSLISRAWKDVPAKLVWEFCFKGIDKGQSLERFGLGLICFEHELYLEAENEFKEAKGENVSSYLKIIDDHFSKEAEGIFKQAKKDATDKQWKSALNSLVRVRTEHPTRTFVKENSAAIDALIEETLKGSALPADTTQATTFFGFRQAVPPTQLAIESGTWKVEDETFVGSGESGVLQGAFPRIQEVIVLFKAADKKPNMTIKAGEFVFKVACENGSIRGCVGAQAISAKWACNLDTWYSLRIRAEKGKLLFLINEEQKCALPLGEFGRDGFSISFDGPVEGGKKQTCRFILDSMLIVAGK